MVSSKFWKVRKEETRVKWQFRWLRKKVLSVIYSYPKVWCEKDVFEDFKL